MKIKGFEKLSCVDYPGHVACVIFLGGCNLRCGFCYNKKLVTNIHEISDIDKSTIIAYIHKREKMLDGICVTGGEPTVNQDLPDLLIELKECGLPIKLDTNGTNPRMIRSLIDKQLVDYIALDIKAPLNTQYKTLTSIHIDMVANIRRTLCTIANAGIGFEIRTTVIPTIHSITTLEVMKSQIFQTLGPNYNRSQLHWYLQPFIPRDCLSERYNSFQATTRSELEDMASRLRGGSISAQVYVR